MLGQTLQYNYKNSTHTTMSKLSPINKPLFTLAGQLGSINFAELGEGICIARGANIYAVIFDPHLWEIAIDDGPEVDYREPSGKRAGYILQNGTEPLTKVVSEAMRIFRSKTGKPWNTKTQPTVLTMAELADAAA